MDTESTLVKAWVGGDVEGSAGEERESTGEIKGNFHNTLTIKIQFKNDIWIVTYCSWERILEKVIRDCFLVGATS